MSDIIISSLNKSFGENRVLINLNATFPHGKISTIMAASGVGKTTLLRILTGLEKADSGEIKGIESKKISVVFQEDRLCENLSALTNIKFVTNKDDADILTALNEIGLAEFEHMPVNKLSGGMKRRCAIVRALLSDYDILLLDEPFKGLDEDTKQKVMDYTKARIKGKTVILITHVKEEAEILGSDLLLELNH